MPFSGGLAHQSTLKAGLHQHVFVNSLASSDLPINVGDVLFTYIYLDPASMPSEVMLQWHDGVNAEHRAYWGANSINLGVNGTASRRYIGPLPTAGQWVRLEVPASLVGMEGKTLTGMFFTLYNGRATWDRTGKSSALSNLAPTISAVTATPQTLLDNATSQLQVTASDTDGPSALSYQWTISSGGGSLNNSAIANPIYTPANVGTSTPVTLNVAVSDGAATTNRSITLTVNDAGLPLILSTASLASGTVGGAYSQALTASGGITPYTWGIVAGSLPAGLSLNATTGAISGTPTTAGASNFTAQVRDNVGTTASKALSISIVAVNLAPTISAVSATPQTLLDNATSQLQVTVSDSDGPSPLSYQWTILSGGGTLSSASIANPEYTPANVTASTPVTINIAVSDGAATVNSSITLTVNDAGLPPPNTDFVWIEDALPPGVAQHGDEPWTFVSANPAPFSGGLAHQSALKAGLHQHGFINSLASSDLPINVGDVLFSYIYLDPANPPSEVLLQWYDGVGFEHRAYWGANSIALGVDGTASRRSIGPLPAAGQWVRLEVPASLVGMEGKTLKGMFFTLYNGRATWDRTGKSSAVTNVAPTIGALTATPQTLLDTATSQLQVTASDADGPSALSYNWSIVSGGGTLSSATITNPVYTPANVSTGTPVTINVAVYDGVASATQNIILTVNDAGLPLAVSTNTLTGGTVGSVYTQTLAASGGITPYTWSIAAGTLPAGITLNGTTGIISGTPTAVGNSNITVRVADVNNTAATKALTITIGAANVAPTISSATAAPATLLDNQTSQLQVTASDSDGPSALSYSWSILTGGGTLSSTTTANPVYTPANVTASTPVMVRVTVSDGAASTTRDITLTVNDAGLPLSISTTSLVNGTVGSAYSQTNLEAAGGITPYTWSISAGTLPVGLILNATTGVISGTPPAAGSSNFTVRVADVNNTATTKALTINVVANVVPSIGSVTATPQTLLDNQTSQLQVTASDADNGPNPLSYTWSIVSGGGSISNTSIANPIYTPTQVDATTPVVVDVIVSDGLGLASQNISLTINDAGLPLVLSTPGLREGVVGAAYSQVLDAQGGISPFLWSISTGALPAGITLNANTGALSGTPTVAGLYGFTARVTDSNGTVAVKSLAITITSTNLLPVINKLTASPPIPGTGATQLQILASDIDGPNELTYQWSIEAGGGSLSSTTIQNPLYTPPSPVTGNGQVKLRVNVSDGLAPVSRTITLAVNHQFDQVWFDDDVPPGAILNTVSGLTGATWGWYNTSTLLPFNSRGFTVTGYAPIAYLGSLVHLGPTAYEHAFLNATDKLYVYEGDVLFAYAYLPTNQFSLNLRLGWHDETKGWKEAYWGREDSPSSQVIGNVERKFMGAIPIPVNGWVRLSVPASALGLEGGVVDGMAFPVGVVENGGGYSTTQLIWDFAGKSSKASVLEFATSILPRGVAGTKYKHAMSVHGGKPPYNWTVTNGVLPSGVSMSSATGELSGQPLVAGSTNFTVTVQDANGFTVSQALNINIDPVEEVWFDDALPSGAIVGTAPILGYEASAWEWVSINPESFSGNFAHRAQTTSNLVAQHYFTSASEKLNIQAGDYLYVYAYLKSTVQTIQIQWFSSDGAQHSAFWGNDNFRSGAKYAGRLPLINRWVRLSVPASLVGLEGQSVDGISFSVYGVGERVTFDRVGRTRYLPLELQKSGNFVGNIGINFITRNTDYSTTGGFGCGAACLPRIQVLGGVAPYTWSVSKGTLPAGLVLDTSSGIISGTPTTPGRNNLNVQVRDGIGNTATLEIVMLINEPPVVEVQANPSTLNTTQTSQLQVTAIPPSQIGPNPHLISYIWRVISGGGVLSASNIPNPVYFPPAVSSTTAVTLNLRVCTIGAVCLSRDVILTVNNSDSIPLTIQNDTILPAATENTPYSASLLVSGGLPPYSWNIVSGTLTPGLTLNTTTGVISGTSTVAGGTSYYFTVRVLDGQNAVGYKSFSLKTNRQNVAPTINSVSANKSILFDDESTRIQVLASDSDSGPSPLSYTWRVVSGSGSFDDATSRITTFRPSPVQGEAEVILKITVSDGAAIAERNLALTVRHEAGTAYIYDEQGRLIGVQR